MDIPSSSRSNGPSSSNGFARPALPAHRNGNSNANLAAQSTSTPNIITSEMYHVPGVKHKAAWRLLSQTVDVSSFSFETKSFRVHTDIVLLPGDENVNYIYFHLGTHALLPMECPEMGGKIRVNGVDTKYRRRHPLTKTTDINPRMCIAELETKFYDNLNKNDYCMEVTVPAEFKPLVRQKKAIKVSIDVMVKQPLRGVQFTENQEDRENEEHVFTYRTPFMTGTREWLPCYDEPDQVGLWQFNFTVEKKYVVVCSAELRNRTLKQDGQLITYTFQQAVPTSACNIGWSIGQFNPEPHPESPTIHTFSLPGLEPVVKYTTTYLDKMLEFLEEKLSCRFAYPTLKIVFVDKGNEDINAYSSLLIAPTSLLYHKKVIDVVQDVRQQLIFGIAQQFFGCFIGPSHWIYWWLMVSISKVLTNLYVESKLGLAESRWQLKRAMDDVCDYEHQWGKIVLSPDLQDHRRINLHFDPRHEYTCSPLYIDAMIKKGFLTMRMLLKKLGQEPFLRVLHRLLTVGLEMGEKKNTPGAWKHLLTCTEAFFRSVSTVTGSEIPTFVEQWIRTGGHAAFAVRFEFNRKRNMVELEVKQDDSEGNGRSQYTGPLNVVVQEVDGAFTHTIQIDGAITKADVQCHSKGRKQKKKKVPLLTGEEVDIDLTNMDAESPVLWVRLDHDYCMIREINISQPIFHWEYMLTYERDVIAQMEALERIQTFPSAQSRSVITDTVSNVKFFYRIRCRAAFVLSAVQNRKTEALTAGTPVLINMFRETYGSKAAPKIPKPNNFVVTSQNLQQYFVMQALPQAIGKLRKHTGECNEEAVTFLLDLIQFNDNTTNRYSDDYYRASLYNALAACVYPCEGLPSHVELPENLSAEIRNLIREFTYALNMDSVNPSYGRVVGVAALNGLYQLQKCGYLPMDSRLLWMFAAPKVCVQVRRAAVTLLVDRVVNDNHADYRMQDLMLLLELAEKDEDPSVRILVPRLLAQTPPFGTYNNTQVGFTNICNTPALADRIWSLMTNKQLDGHLRSGFTDLYFSLFGLGIPPVKGGPAEAPGHHRSYVASSNPSASLATSHWHSSAYEASRRSPPRVSIFGDDSMNL